MLRLDMPAWRPINVMFDSEDTRDLGIMVDRITFGAGIGERAAPITSPEPRAGER